MGEKAYKIVTDDDEDTETTLVASRVSRLHIVDGKEDADSDFEDFRDSEDDDMSYTLTPPPDDTKRNYFDATHNLCY